jgi:hypothetical protein
MTTKNPKMNLCKISKEVTPGFAAASFLHLIFSSPQSRSVLSAVIINFLQSVCLLLWNSGEMSHYTTTKSVLFNRVKQLGLATWVLQLPKQLCSKNESCNKTYERSCKTQVVSLTGWKGDSWL